MNATEIIAIVSEALALPRDYDLKPDVRIIDVPGWDSFAWVTIISAIEERSGTEFPVNTVDKIHKIGDLISVASNLKSNVCDHG